MRLRSSLYLHPNFLPLFILTTVLAIPIFIAMQIHLVLNFISFPILIIALVRFPILIITLVPITIIALLLVFRR